MIATTRRKDHAMTTDPINTIRERLDVTRDARRDHVKHNRAKPGQGPFYRTGDDDVLFTRYTDMQYYERLTGHIEELEYLLKAMER